MKRGAICRYSCAALEERSRTGDNQMLAVDHVNLAVKNGAAMLSH